MSNKDISSRGNRGLADVNHAPLKAAFNMALISGAIVKGSTASAITTTVAITYLLGGLLLAKAAMTNFVATITGADDDSTSQAAGTTCYYVYCLDSSGNVEVYKGVDDAALYPVIPDGRAAFAVAKVVNATNEFTLGTTNYDASGVTTTFTNVGQVPAAVV